MSSDRDDGRRHGGGAGSTAGQGGEPSPGRGAECLNELRARMRAIESGSRSADADRPPRESLFSDAGFSDAGIDAAASVGADAGADSGDAADAAPTAGPSSRPPQAQAAQPRASQPPPGGHRPDRPDGWNHGQDAGQQGEQAPATDASRDPPATGLFPAAPSAQPSAETAFEHPFADGDGHLFDQSTSGPSPRERRRAQREQSPTQRALGLLVRREHSRKELTRKLTSRGLDRERVVEAVDRLRDAGWQDDARFAETLVRSRANNGYGPVHIRAELGTHGLDGEAIAAAMDAYEGDWLENARDLLRRRFGEAYAEDLARRRKAADLLMRRGFEMETIRIASCSYASD